MATRSFLIIIIAGSLLLFNCETKKPTDKQRSREILSSRTLGLAYLEENKLKEAEEEFLKLIDLAPEEALGHANLGLVYLRMGDYEKAEENLINAIDIEPEDPDIQLILAKVYELSEQSEKSLQVLEKIITSNPAHTKTLYALAETYKNANDTESIAKRIEYLGKIVKEVPENLVARLLYVESLIQNGDSDEAINQLEDISRIFPEFPAEANEYYNQTIDLLRKGETTGAFTSIKIFHNFFKVSGPYQAGIQELKGPGGELIGFPLITLGESSGAFWFEGEDLLEAMRFTDVTQTVGLDEINISPGSENFHSNLAVCDFDNDGDLDIYFSRFENGNSNPENFLFKNEMGSFSQITNAAGLNHIQPEHDALFGDYDNDGFLDLYLLAQGNNLLFRNTGQDKFENMAEEASADDPDPGNFVLFMDFDHEGDLDLFIGKKSGNVLLRNNGDGTFTDLTAEAGVEQSGMNSKKASFGDFDDDGDIDLFIINTNGPLALLDNQRQGRFEDISAETGLGNNRTAVTGTAGDYDNDGYLDLLFIEKVDNTLKIFKNKGDGRFEEDSRSEEVFENIGNLEVNDMILLDFDNDGFEDILVAGKSNVPDKSGLFLYHNDSLNIFRDVSHLLPKEIRNVYRIRSGDFNEDGDQDIYLTTGNGHLKLLRNDGGNANHYLKLQLVGVRTGSSKNNYFGIGSKVEVRAGDLYQMKVVTQPNMHFGLGDRSGADVVRIQWTNGTPQNIFTPRSDQDLIEEQELKGSCPFLYTWNGSEYVFVKDMMWRSALGMPLGIMTEDTKYAFSDASREYLKIPGDLLQPGNGKYSIQITSELWETMFYDELFLVAIDHPAEMDVYVDEKFIPPPFPELELFAVTQHNIPLSAVDDKGNDLLPYIQARDDEYISNFKLGVFQGITEMKDIILDLGDQVQKDNLFLFLHGWIFPTDASINVAVSQSEKTKVIAPYLQVKDQKGNWVTAIENFGFPLGKNKTIIVDLSDKILTHDHRVRIRTNMQIYWDYIFHAPILSDPDIVSTKMNPEMADLHYRGFSDTYRKGGRYGPHWFDYNNVSKDTKWRDLEGYYTRYGNVLPLITSPDSKYVIANAGDEITIEFGNAGLPVLQEGWKRDFLIYSVGWVKDGDMNTAHGQTVEPLPFHGMSAYPYGPEEHYPADPEYLEYMETFNIREISSEQFKRAIYDLY